MVNGDANGKPILNGHRSSYTPKSKPRETVDHSANRQDVESSFGKYAQVIHTSQSPLPTQTGDPAHLEHSEPSGLFQDLKSLGFKDVGTLMQVMKNKASGELQDDKTYMMEHVIQLVAGLPHTSKTRVDLTNAFIDELWNSMQHPPMSYLGKVASEHLLPFWEPVPQVARVHTRSRWMLAVCPISYNPYYLKK